MYRQFGDRSRSPDGWVIERGAAHISSHGVDADSGAGAYAFAMVAVAGVDGDGLASRCATLAP
jgi:hypothetical protein